MKKDIHPQYYSETEVHCACGARFTVNSTKERIETEICSNCHPFYTGGEKNLDTMKQVQKFKERMAKTKKMDEKKRKA